MADNKSIKQIFKNYWLFALVVLQPLLDIVAFWTSSETGTIAGYIRLLFMLILPVHLLFTCKDKKRFIASMGIIALLALLHVGNLCRVGYINFFSDIKNMARIIYMPVMAVCLCTYVRDERMKKQALNGILVNAVIIALVIIISYLTDSYNPTYGYGLGTSAWVTDENRCTHSVILSCLSVFGMWYGLNSKRSYASYIIPAAVFVFAVTNGTSSCYLTALACFGGYAFFMIFRRRVRGERLCRAEKFVVIYLALLFVIAVAIYPETPHAKIVAIEREAANKGQNNLEKELLALGYDVRSMSPEERMNEPVVREKMAEFYTKTIYGGAPGLIESFDVYRIMKAYNMTTNASKIADVRRMKRVNAKLIWEDSDFLTKLTGFEFARVDWPGDSLDLENDWHAIFYYYGVIGLAAYAAYILYFFFLVLKKLKKNFKSNMTLYNFCLLLCLLLLLGLAHFSGALLKRPNSSIYLALVLALLNYQTRFSPEGETAAGGLQ
ncbi:MAG: O-antigen ligase family protein [Candidatus Limivicinus sp.]|jgi:cell division protein FtsL